MLENKRHILSVSLLLVSILAAGQLVSACAAGNGPAPASTPVPPEAYSNPTEPWTSVPPTLTEAPAPNELLYQNARRYRVEYVATVTNRDFVLSKLDFYQPRPVEWDSQKDVLIEAVSPEPTAQGQDPVYGNGLYYWGLQNLPQRGGSLQFTIRFTFTTYESVARVDPGKVLPYDQAAPLYQLYTRPERYIESDDPAILRVADQVAAGESNPYRLARKFYDYVIATAHYRLLGRGLQGAKALLTNGVGECGDYSSLFIALARAKGIPARPVVGYWAISGLDQAHVWAEFYLQGVGWIPVDPTIGQQSASQQAYYFGHLDNQRVILNKGFNIHLVPQAPDHYVADFLQVPFWWYWGTSGDPNSVSMDRTSWRVTPIP